ncbi:hypothetical protein [Lysinibacillus capsici]|uniref:hypothetical protein n=1 Tax=Lysinibacillus capsici TaxID=2115968 RepID=UPI000E206268|nr:hypothetical protein [Lysinibacillus capsici]RDV27775.1 hypothetical protein C7B89_19550 [Lysinibacillus capsici]
MAKYESRYKSLGFYANGELKRFNNGTYVTEDKDEITVLDGLADVTRVDEEPKTEAKPVIKAPAKRTASAK